MGRDDWARGGMRTKVRLGVPFGAFMAVFFFAQRGDVVAALVEGVICGALFGAAMARYVSKRWSEATDLEPGDRVTVARLVRRGDDIEDARLASAVLAYVEGMRDARIRDRRYRWAPWAFGLLALTVALSSTFAGSGRSATFWWVMVALYIGMLAWMPRIERRWLTRFDRAEADAKRLLHPPSAG